MIRVFGVFKVAFVIIIDFLYIYYIFHDETIAVLISCVIIVYTLLGGYLALFQENAIYSKKLPNFERLRLENAKRQLTKDVKNLSSIDISGIKIYMIDGDDDIQATAYGAKCISVSKGVINHIDPITLNSILAHEISHIINLDPEFNRAIFITVLLACCSISILLFSTIAVVFIIFVIFSLFNSWVGFIAFKGIRKILSTISSILQKCIVLIYRTIVSCISRYSEFRADRYSADLGYGIQLLNFLTYIDSRTTNYISVTEALYRMHPPTTKRILRLEAILNNEPRITR